MVHVGMSHFVNKVGVKISAPRLRHGHPRHPANKPSGPSFGQSSEDASITAGPSVTTNDSGTFEVLSTSAVSAGGSAVTIDDSSGVIGRFTYDPSPNADAQMLQAGESLEDTFSYTIVGQAPLTPNVTASLIPTAAVNDVVWGGLPPITPASAGWRYVGFGLHRLRAGDQVSEATGENEVILVMVEVSAVHLPT